MATAGDGIPTPQSDQRNKKEPASSTLRLVAICSACLASAAWAFLALASYPIIVIADSDLGMGAMQRLRDAGGMFLISLGVLVLSCRFIPYRLLRVTLITGVLGILALYSFETSSTSYTARWPLIGLIGFVLAVEFIETRKTHLRLLQPLFVIGIPALFILTDYEGRIYLGRLPSGYGPRSVNLENLRTSVSLMDGEYGAKAISPLTKLRAIGKDDGTLIVEHVDGGPARTVPASAPDRMLQVLSFSPDGKTLAVADNHRMYAGSVITVWDVSPGQPPAVTLRHTLRGHTHWTFSLDWFPDSKILVSANGDDTVRLWAVDSGKEIGQFNPHHDYAGLTDMAVDCVATSPDGRTFVTWACDGHLKLWEKDSFQLLRSMETRGSVPCALAFTPDGNGVIATDREGTNYFTLHPSPILFLVLVSLTSGLLLWMFCPRRLFNVRRVPD
jgi:hypothetical protein